MRVAYTLHNTPIRRGKNSSDGVRKNATNWDDGMTKNTKSLENLPRSTRMAGAVEQLEKNSDALGSDTETLSIRNSDIHTDATFAHRAVAGGAKVNRGVSAIVSTSRLHNAILLRTLQIANRFRVIRTIDVAVACFADRASFKASLSAAQRATRGAFKKGFLSRRRSDRFMTIYGLTEKGAHWLEEYSDDANASSSVRRVNDMTNPEHRLWLQFFVLAAEARGYRARTESELLQNMNKERKAGEPLSQGLLSVQVSGTKGTVKRRLLRPDAIAFELPKSDENPGTSEQPGGCVWAEIQISKMGADRDASFAALVNSMGALLANGRALTTVVLLAKTKRILLRALAVIESLSRENNQRVLVGTRKHVKKIDDGIFEVWSARESKLQDGRVRLVDTLEGHVIVQLLPTWLPKVRIDATNKFSTAGWFTENYLPFRRAPSMGAWAACSSPLLPQREKAKT